MEVACDHDDRACRATFETASQGAGFVLGALDGVREAFHGLFGDAQGAEHTHEDFLFGEESDAVDVRDAAGACDEEPPDGAAPVELRGEVGARRTAASQDESEFSGRVRIGVVEEASDGGE